VRSWPASLAGELQPNEPMWLAESLNGLGFVHKDTHRFVDAGRHYHQALALAPPLGPDDPD
jgi:Flp pilus assembly protein TadD